MCYVIFRAHCFFLFGLKCYNQHTILVYIGVFFFPLWHGKENARTLKCCYDVRLRFRYEIVFACLCVCIQPGILHKCNRWRHYTMLQSNVLWWRHWNGFLWIETRKIDFESIVCVCVCVFKRLYAFMQQIQ